MRFKLASSLFMLLLLGSNITDGQVLGPELKAGKFEIGGFSKYFHRKLKPHYLYGGDWFDLSIFMKYGMNKWITLSAEGLVWSPKDLRFPNSNYRRYILGAGITSRVFKIKDFRITLALHYNEIFLFDRAPYEGGSAFTYHKNTRGVIGTIQVERSLSFHGKNVTLWVAPAYVYDEVLQYSSLSFNSYSDKSFNNFGFAIGANFMLFKHIEPFFQIVYADFFQPRGGIGYQF